MDRELEVIRDEMEQTRASLADKLGALEGQVRETVSTASETVASTVEGVKEVVGTVSETVEDVTETLNISKHVERHPWLAMGIALAAGFTLAQLFGGRSEPRQAPQPPVPPAPPPPQPQPPRRQEALPPLEWQRPEASAPASASASSQTKAQPQPSSESGILGQLSSALPSMESLMPDIKGIGDTVISGLGGLAVGSVMSVVRDLVKNNVPQDWQGEITKMVDQVTRQLGGKPQAEHQQHGQGQGQEHKPAQQEQHGQGQRAQEKETPQGPAQQGDRSKRSGRPEPAYPT